MKLQTKQKVARWASIASLVCLLIAFTQCIATPQKSSSSSSTVEQSNAGGLMAAQDEAAPNVGVKDADAIYLTMSTVTGIPATNGNTANAYAAQKPQMPIAARVESLNESQLMAITKLAAEFCNELVNNGAQRAIIWPRNNLGVVWTNAAAFPANDNGVKRGDFAEDTLKAFWGDNTRDVSVYNDGYAELTSLMDDLLAGAATTNNATITMNTAKAVCTAALASAPVWMQ